MTLWKRVGTRTHGTSIRRQLQVVVTASLAFGLLLNYVIFAVYDYHRQQTDVRRWMTSTADIIAGTCDAALSFYDTVAATTILQSLMRARTDILSVTIRNGQNQVFVSETRRREQASTVLSTFFAQDLITIQRPIGPAELGGQIVIEFAAPVAGEGLWGHIIVTTLGTLVSYLIVLALSQSGQKRITEPLAALADAMEHVESTHDYTTRLDVSKQTDELHRIGSGFNRMLQRIEAQENSREQQIEDRTRELHASREEALAASVAKSQFLANISHEIRTPMNGILGMAQLLATSTLDKQQRRHTETIQGSTRTLLRIINDILDFSKIEAGKMQFENIPFDLPRAIHEVTGPFQDDARHKGVSLTLDINDSIPTVLSDPVRIKQILSNLISNAIKFTDAGGTVNVSAQAVRDTGDALTLTIRVRDTGCGMKGDAMARIFTPFCQGDSSTTRKYGGTGLGLTITKQLVDTIGGAIEVSSHPGQGTLFAVTLPLSIAELHAPLTPELVAPATVPSLPGVKILVADDNPVNLEYIALTLASAGCTVRTACNGREAVQAFGEEAFHLVLMDCQMPELDGITALKEIRAKEQDAQSWACIPVIAVTAYAMDGDRENYLSNEGFTDYLSKPFTQAQLFAVILRNI